MVADIDLGMISLAKAAADPAGHYSRPDVTRLLLNKTPGEPVVFAARSGGGGRRRRGRGAERRARSRRRALPLRRLEGAQRWNPPSPST